MEEKKSQILLRLLFKSAAVLVVAGVVVVCRNWIASDSWKICSVAILSVPLFESLATDVDKIFLKPRTEESSQKSSTVAQGAEQEEKVSRDTTDEKPLVGNNNTGSKESRSPLRRIINAAKSMGCFVSLKLS
ncbi:MAG: hypothetical protein P4M13_03710 [Alphaproteobacteria bacterium]|nr:hypothetical protein [Alphaproteobacteria bacterium]